MTSPTYIARLLRNEVAHCQASYAWAQKLLDDAAQTHATRMRDAEAKHGLLAAAIAQQQDWTAKHPETKEDEKHQ